jgi:hypothetical protein
MNVIDSNNLEHDVVRKPLRTFRHHARASRPDMMHSAGVAELVDALDLGSSDESCGGSSPSARTKRFQRLHNDDWRSCFAKGASPEEKWLRRTTGAGFAAAPTRLTLSGHSGRTKREED